MWNILLTVLVYAEHTELVQWNLILFTALVYAEYTELVYVEYTVH